MKKNLWFKLGLFCTALVLVATCFITNAWAKYTKSVTATDSARVAKFEIEVKEGTEEFNGTLDLFKTALTNIKQVEGENKDTTGQRIIAPGSHGSTEIVLSNKSEVTVTFTLTVEKDSNTESIPLIFWIDDDTANTYNSFTEAVNAAFTNAEIQVGGADISKKINWEWKYYVDDARDTDDTTLGLAGTAKYEVKLKVTADQKIPA